MDTQFFIPITKRDDEQHMVYGYASTPDLDTQDDIVTVEALEKALPEYMKFPTIREMHQAKAVGVTKEATIHNGKGLFIGAKVVDKDAWEKVKEGVYRAFSIGGRSNKRLGKQITDLTLTEVSLVDSPANKNAVITLYKANADYGSKKKPVEKNSVEVSEALTKYMDEYAVASVPVDPKEKATRALMSASNVLCHACELCYTRAYLLQQGVSTAEVDSAIESLKLLAANLLTNPQYQKFDDILATVGKSGGMQIKHLADFIKVQSGVAPLQEVFMVKDEKQLTKAEEAVVEEKETVVETPVEEAKPEVKPEKPAEDSKTEEVVADKEASESTSNLEKLEKMSKDLADDESEEESTDDEDETEKMAKSDLVAKMTEQSQALEKMGTQVSDLSVALTKATAVLGQVVDRVKQLEAQPAAPKTAHNYVVETTVVKGAGSKNPRVTEIQARLRELSNIRENNLTKFQTDHQQEAFGLMNELDTLQS